MVWRPKLGSARRIESTATRFMVMMIITSFLVTPILAADQPSAFEVRGPTREGIPDFIDTTYDVESNDFREPIFVEYHGKVHVFWMTKVQNTWIGATNVIKAALIKTRSFDARNGVLKFDPMFMLTPNSNDTMGAGNIFPTPVVYKDKLYLFWACGDTAQRPPDAMDGAKVIYKVFDGTNWSAKASLVALPETSGLFSDDTTINTTIYNDKLYVTWTRTIADQGYTYGKILSRAFDGQYWGKQMEVSGVLNTTATDNPHMAVYKTSLYVVWHAKNTQTGDIRVMVNSFDGTQWGTSQEIFYVPDPVSGYFSNPRIAAYKNPATGKDELWGVWTTYGVGAFAAGPNDWDIVGRIFNGTGWGDVFQLTSPTDQGPDMNPQIAVFKGRVYVAWECSDSSVKPGPEKSIVMRVNDGYGWTGIKEVSRPGQREIWDSKHEYRLGDDEWVTLGVYENKLCAMYRTLDNITGRDGTKDIILRNITAYDSNGDGYMDGQVVPPRTVKSSTGTGNEGTFASLTCLVVVLFMVLVAALIYIFERPGRDEGKDEDALEEEESDEEE